MVSMTTVDDLWFLSDVARQQAEQTYHEVAEEYTEYLEFTRDRRVSRDRYRTVAERIRENGLPYGAHTVTVNQDGELLLVWHDLVGMWVLPGGEVEADDSFRAAAQRELREEAGIEATYDGLGMLGRVEFRCNDHTTWGVLPIFEAEAKTTDLQIADPDGEITDAGWFADLPADTRDRDQLQRWQRQRQTE
jgi:8-oxo-dGTP diphosphatase